MNTELRHVWITSTKKQPCRNSGSLGTLYGHLQVRQESPNGNKKPPEEAENGLHLNGGFYVQNTPGPMANFVQNIPAGKNSCPVPFVWRGKLPLFQPPGGCWAAPRAPVCPAAHVWLLGFLPARTRRYSLFPGHILSRRVEAPS